MKDLETKVIYEYWKTLGRKNVSNIITSKFLKKPYIENYIIELSSIVKNFDDKIVDLIDSNEVNIEDILLFIKNNFEFNIDEKKYIETYLLNNNFDDPILNSIAIEIINYQIEYFRFYQLIDELLFENEDESNELYNFILIYFKNNKNSIKGYINKNIKFKIFYNNIQNLSYMYKNMYNLLLKHNFLPDNDTLTIQNLFLKNLFTNWYNIYKKDILENKVNDKIKDYKIERSILSRILCLPNI